VPRRLSSLESTGFVRIPAAQGAVQFAVMRAAERHRKFVADLLRQPAGLRKTQMVRVTGLAAADEAGLFCNEPQVLLVPCRFASGSASTLLSMRERGSSLAVGAGFGR
jgi:hypothetical protein